VFIPDATGLSWSHLGLVEEFRESRCISDPRECPRIAPFLKHHMVERSIPVDSKVKTMAGNKLWWSQVGDSRYVYPGGIKVLNHYEAWNGEMWEIERPLWPTSDSL
jgi:hypothetical protein